jgi:CheY-like chemotaxis protein
MVSRPFKQRRKQFKVVACALSWKDLLKRVAQHQPDVALISATLENEPTAGLQALRELSLTRSSTRVVMLLDCSEPEQVVEAFSDGWRRSDSGCGGLPGTMRYRACRRFCVASLLAMRLAVQFASIEDEPTGSELPENQSGSPPRRAALQILDNRSTLV